MKFKLFKTVSTFFWITCLLFLSGCREENPRSVLDQTALAKEYYGEDSKWYMDNIPFFECSDKEIEQVYYYRWKMYKAHIRNLGSNHYVITEFINHVGWDREPYCTINAASMHHIYEGRWLKDNRYMDGYIDYLFQNGGNNRSYSESIADAAYARYLVNADSVFICRQLDSMKYIYTLWQDHWDSSKQLYYIPAMPDATEFTIASIDASGGKGGFEDGEAFRPTINSYIYGNAMAISKIAALKGDASTAQEYFQRAARLKLNVEKYLWNDSLKHFTDRFKVNNAYVHYWDFIRGRELAGLIPWYFNLPADSPLYNAAWKHVTDTSELLGRFGLRTNEPSYQYYFKQFLIYQGQPGSQWNGPSWPYQSSQVITAMANFLNNYKQEVVTTSDYLHLLRQFTRQHYLPNGKINLVENYDPNLGGPIVYYYWSNHYNHSSFNNLVISGLCGIRPSSGDTLNIHPLADSSIHYFCIDDLRYHGHRLTVVYDQDGDRYHLGKGLIVFVDGKKTKLIQDGSKNEVVIGKPIILPPSKGRENFALNLLQKGYPLPSASINSSPDTSLYQAIDGRIWYFPEITNRWTTLGSSSKTDWWAIEFGTPKEISEVSIYFVSDNKDFLPPDDISIEYQKDDQWLPVKMKEQKPAAYIGNTANRILFDKITARRLRINFSHHSAQVAVSEIEIY
jgi:hypothetical protein